MTSRRKQILEAIVARLERIQQSDDFETDAGLRLYLGDVPMIGTDDPDVAIAIVVGDDQPSFNGEQVALELPLEIQALAKAEIEQPWLAAEQVLADIKRAIEVADRSLGGLARPRIRRGPTRTIPREPGSTTIGISVLYVVPYVEKWGAP